VFKDLIKITCDLAGSGRLRFGKFVQLSESLTSSRINTPSSSQTIIDQNRVSKQRKSWSHSSLSATLRNFVHVSNVSYVSHGLITSPRHRVVQCKNL